MSRKSIINKVVQDNYKFNQYKLNDNNIIKDQIEEDDSFNQLLSLQLLIQKHSGLKELCKYY